MTERGWALLILLAGAVINFLLPRLRTAGQEDTNKKFADINERFGLVDAAIDGLTRDTYGTQQRVDSEHRLTTIETSIKVLQLGLENARTTQAELLRLLEKALIPVAHSPHTMELDKLLEKRDRGEPLSRAELNELLKRLREQAKLETTPGKQIALLGIRAILITQYRLKKRQ